MDPCSWNYSTGPEMLQHGATDHRHERSIWMQLNCCSVLMRTLWRKDYVMFFILMNGVHLWAFIYIRSIQVNILLCWYCFSIPRTDTKTNIDIWIHACLRFFSPVSYIYEHCKCYPLSTKEVIMSNNVFSEQSNLVYRHFLCCVAYLFFCILLFFYGMLNVG